MAEQMDIDTLNVGVACNSAYDALPLVLQQPDAEGTKLLRRLLCVSKELGRHIEAVCKGQLTVKFATFIPQHMELFSAWLAKYGSCIRVLEVDYIVHNKDPTASDTLAHALQHAASATGLCLSSFQTSSIVSKRVVQCLPVNHLTSLVITGATTLGRSHAMDLVAASVALQGLTQLRHLTLEGTTADTLPFAAPHHGLKHLIKLTSISLHAISSLSVGFLHTILPEQLLDIAVHQAAVYEGMEPPAVLQLAQLTAVTTLSTGNVHAGDVLPPSLQVLHVKDCCSTSPLLPLKQLKELQVSACRMTADDLATMGGALTNLTAIHLVYAGTQNPINQAVAGFCMLQLRSLTVSNGSNSGGKPGPVRNSQQHPQLKMGSSSFRQLGSIRGLTSLTLIGVQIGVLPAAQLADTFKQMTALRALQLSDVLLESGRGSVTSAMGGPAYTRIAALPYLESLSLTGMHLQYSDAAALAAAAHLTHLKMCDGSYLHDSVITVLLSGLTQLKDLDLAGSRCLTDAVLPVIDRLTLLTRLSVGGTHITRKGLAKLAGPKGLKGLGMGGW